MREIIDKGSITKLRAVQLVGSQYHNQRKHTGAILSNMIRRGYIERVKRGVFRLPTK